jgi:hypothetical protein
MRSAVWAVVASSVVVTSRVEGVASRPSEVAVSGAVR